MTINVNPYLTFEHAEDAMRFYQSVFGGDLSISRFGEFGTPEGIDPEGVMHATLTSPVITLMASDNAMGGELVRGNASNISLSGDDADELRELWARLSEGAQIVMPLERQMWGDEYGQLVDRFGVSWMVDITGLDAESDQA